MVDILFERCQKSATATVSDTNLSGYNKRIRLLNTTDTASQSEFQSTYKSSGGVAESQDDTGIHRDESEPFADGTKVSIKVTTNTDSSEFCPFIFDLHARPAALSNASTDTVRIYFAVVNTVTLTDINSRAELIYPDGTSSQIPVYLSNGNSDILAAGTEWTDDSGGSTWMDGGVALTGHNEYFMDLDTSGVPGSDSVPIVRIYLGVTSEVVYFDTTIDAVP